MPVCRPLALVSVAAAILSITACSKDSDAPATQAVSVKSGDDTCDVATTTFEPGEVTFDAQNTGSDVTEVYVYAKEGGAYTKVVAEVENIGPGTSRKLTADLDEGTYQVTCKPGMVGEGVPALITVEAGAADGS